ncbi:hypothetical protein ACFYTQ_07700 [Nocardia sp. NPDC004068]|uniref:hypothetical protein n=1 Tax=Nocardia sp. NPDC004068 TaxID=3364303 RepID=UPI00367E9B4C
MQSMLMRAGLARAVRVITDRLGFDSAREADDLLDFARGVGGQLADHDQRSPPWTVDFDLNRRDARMFLDSSGEQTRAQAPAVLDQEGDSAQSMAFLKDIHLMHTHSGSTGT